MDTPLIIEAGGTPVRIGVAIMETGITLITPTTLMGPLETGVMTDPVMGEVPINTTPPYGPIIGSLLFGILTPMRLTMTHIHI